MKWLIWWRDGDVTVWDAAQWPLWPLWRLEEMRNVVDVRMVEGPLAVLAMVAWWREDAA